jgi:hypothetical protein
MVRRQSVVKALGVVALFATGWIPTSPCTSCPNIAVAQPTPIPGPTCYGFTTIDIGEYSQFGYWCGGNIFDSRIGNGSTPCYADVAHPAFEAIIRDECTFEDFWVQHSSLPVPSVDFTKDYVIAVVAGSRPSGCYGMEIDAVFAADCGVKIHVRERIPCPDEFCTRALTNPFHIIRICKLLLPWETPTCFEHRLSQRPDCHIFLDCAYEIDE